MQGRSLCALGVLTAVVCVVAFPAHSRAQKPAADIDLARRYFREARALCRRDGGRLWGKSLCGPMLFVQPSTRAVVANQPDGEGLLKRHGDIFVGVLPQNVNVANTAAEWAGVKWLMVMFPALPEDKFRRAGLLAHELWHRAQEELGFPASGAANAHLDTREGRVWLQLEWRALAAALSGRGQRRRRAAADALLFRAHRRSLFPQAAAEEREMEMHEGLAEYTGVRLSGTPDPARHVVEIDLKQEAGRETFVRSFAYASGPAYGVLLDAAAAGWTRKLRKTDDLGALLRKHLRVRLPADVRRAAAERARVYDGGRLMASEAGREERREKLLAGYRARLVDGPVLMLPLRRMRMTFDPGNLAPLEGHGTVYPNIRIVDVWGILHVSAGGALMNSTYSGVRVSSPTDAGARPARGDGWTLELNEGWALAPGGRRGDYTVRAVKGID